MKVKKCEKCAFYQRKTWSKVHQPKNFHAIGMTFAYGYCKKNKMRCADIKNCKQEVNNETEETARSKAQEQASPAEELEERNNGSG